jgi:hypothetical protein
MKPAPAFECARCARRIGKRRTHYLVGAGRVVCALCLERPHHAGLFPDCGKDWHDVLDHLVTSGTRAGVAAHLGLWP